MRGDPRPVLTILVFPMRDQMQRALWRETPVVVRAITRDETMFKDCYFDTLRDFLRFALDSGWRERYHCVPSFQEHPNDRRTQ